MKRRAILSVFLFAVLGGTIHSQDKKMAVTIDDLPFQRQVQQSGEEIMDMNMRIISFLKEYNVPATGFINSSKLYENGSFRSARMDVLRHWTASGLHLANHTYSHIDYNNVSMDEFFQDIRKNEKYLLELVNSNPLTYRYLRHPYLHRGNDSIKVKALEKHLDETGYAEAPVTLDNSEWIFAAAYDRALDEDDAVMQQKIGGTYVSYMIDKLHYHEMLSDSLFGRGISHILLIHDNNLNAHFLGQLLQAYQSEGYSFISLPDALMDKAYESKDEYYGTAGISWLDRWALTKGKRGAFFANEPRCPEFIQGYSGYSE